MENNDNLSMKNKRCSIRCIYVNEVKEVCEEDAVCKSIAKGILVLLASKENV